MSILEDLAKLSGISVDDIKARMAADAAAEAKARREEQDRIKKENLELASKRDALANKLKQGIKGLNLDDELKKLKCIGVQYTLDRTEKKEGEPDIHITGGCVLMSKYIVKPTTKSSGTRSGELQQFFDTNATPEEKQSMETAVADYQSRGKSQKQINSMTWQRMDKVRDRVSGKS